MNLMRKLRGATSSSSADGSEASSSSSHIQLGLMHLKKLFAEYTHPPQPLTDVEKDDKLYNMLPLFCKQVSKLMVSEIRKRASNQSTEAASCAIAKFLEIENSEESSNGWMLLSTLNLLAAGDQSLIQVMTTASIPSTLVKCLYLFFDLPEIPDSEADVQDTNSKGCVGLCIENMQKIPELTPLEVVEMFVAAFCFLKDSSEVSQLLLDDFRQCHGYVFLSEFLLKHETQDVPDYLTS
ncbi:WD repeat and FYVE domain-containing protein, partial [Operophtera brumata]